VLAGASLQVPRGELVALVGPSGSGKSTMLAILAGLTSPEQGTIRLAGETMPRNTDDPRAAEVRRRRIGLVLQSSPLFEFLSAEANIVEVLRLRGVSRIEAMQRARSRLDAMGVLSRAKERPARLSVGERQRVAIARALACEPEVLLLDEPTASLDHEGADLAMRTIRAYVEGRVGAVLVTHDTRLLRFCDRSLALRNGLFETLEPAPHAHT
jgi:ABC-type lipoprotein export system ATPase subunit